VTLRCVQVVASHFILLCFCLLLLFEYYTTSRLHTKLHGSCVNVPVNSPFYYYFCNASKKYIRMSSSLPAKSIVSSCVFYSFVNRQNANGGLLVKWSGDIDCGEVSCRLFPTAVGPPQKVLIKCAWHKWCNILAHEFPVGLSPTHIKSNSSKHT
jgi:hypothetical protein